MESVEDINIYFSKIDLNEEVEDEKNPQDIFCKLVEEEVSKEEDKNIWDNSKYKDLHKLQSNNVGRTGENYINKLCSICGIETNIDGIKYKKKGGGKGDGTIKNRSVEIKTALMGTSNKSFQHELAEYPWITDYIIFVDIGINDIYLTIFENFKEEMYKSNRKCIPYFPTKQITRRKNRGNFKLDTSLKINEENVKLGITLKITENILWEEIKLYIDNKIK